MANRTDEDQPPEESNAYAPPAAAPQTYAVPRGITKAQRLAGVCLVIGASLMFANKVVESRLRPAEYFSSLSANDPLIYYVWIPVILPISSVILDLVLGLLLIAKKQRVVSWATIRVVLGMILAGLVQAYFLSTNGIDSPTFLLVFLPNIALLILLAGHTSQKLRVALGGSMYALYSLIGLWNLEVAATGVDPLAWVIQTANGTIESESVDEVTGRAIPYKLKLPPDKWYLARNNILGDGTEADRWLVRPDVNAQIVITLDGSPEMGTIPDDYTNTNVREFLKDKKFLVSKREPLRPYPDKGHLVSFDNERSYEPNGWMLGIVTTYRRGYFIQAFAPKKVFLEIEAELRAIIESLELPPDVPKQAPDDCEPNAVTRLEGLAQKYVLSAPSGHWYQRKAEAIKKDNPSTDRWIVLPEKDAHIWVFVESVPSGVIDLDGYTEAVAKTISAETNMTLLSREKPPSHPKEGRILKAKGHSNNVEYHYLYGIYVDGPNAYQIVAVTRSSYFDDMEAELMQAIDTFEWPKAH
jgi:hypothetical protein